MKGFKCAHVFCKASSHCDHAHSLQAHQAVTLHRFHHKYLLFNKVINQLTVSAAVERLFFPEKCLIPLHYQQEIISPVCFGRSRHFLFYKCIHFL